MTTVITASTIKAALRDQRQGKRYDVSDSRVSGLQLRVKPLSVRWSLRARLHGNQKRYDLGPTVEGEKDIDGLSLLTARARAMRIVEMVRKGQNPDTFLKALAAGVSIESQLKREAPARSRPGRGRRPRPSSWPR
jgi:Arm domain-containing DNA-binding protein